MKHLNLVILSVLLSANTFAQKLSPEQLHKFFLELSRKKNLSAAKTYSAPACLMDSMVYSVFDTTTNAFKRNYKEAYLYNAQSNTTSVLDYYDANNQGYISLSSSVALSYDSQGTLTLSLGSYFDYSTSAWIPSRTTYTYNAAGDKIKDFYEYWDPANNTWVNGGRNSYSYTPTHNLTTQVSEYWYSNAWQYSGKNTTSYDAASNPTLVVYYQWTANTSTFDPIQKLMTSYSGNLPTSALSLVWDSNTSTWDNQFLAIYTSSGGDIISCQEQIWTNGVWTTFGNFSCIYDAHHNMLSETIVYLDQITGEVTNQSIYQYYYRCNFVGIKELNALVHFNLYPNPAQSFLYIESEKSFEACRILNINGQMVFENSEAVKSIPVSQLQSGIYFIQLLGKNKSVLATEKFVKE